MLNIPTQSSCLLTRFEPSTSRKDNERDNTTTTVKNIYYVLAITLNTPTHPSYLLTKPSIYVF